MKRGPMMDCPVCGGEGSTWYDAVDRRGEHTTIHTPCGCCSGTGLVPVCLECNGKDGDCDNCGGRGHTADEDAEPPPRRGWWRDADV